MKFVIGITGASGAIYGIRLLEVLKEITSIETHLIISDPGRKTIAYETDYQLDDVKALADVVHDIDDVGASLASGSFLRDGMVIAPCSIKTMSALAHSYTENLLIRAADVTLKERKPLVLLVRETPLHLGHLRNLGRLCEMGAIIFPPIPCFYNKPQSIAEMVDTTVGRVLDLFKVKHYLGQRWQGINL